MPDGRMTNPKKEVVERIRKAIEASRETHIWLDYVNLLDIVAEVVFNRNLGFILELLQNAEDSGRGLPYKGTLEVSFNKKRVKVVHNGRPFNDEDVEALCGVRTTKKPEDGTLGYLGIGFKSLFTVADKVEVCSNGFQFKFDRDGGDAQQSGSMPWYVMPIWFDEMPEAVASDKTTFIVTFRDDDHYSRFADDIKSLGTEVYLFLRWLREIRVTDETSGVSRVLENAGTDVDGITIFKDDGSEQRFKVFTRPLDAVPDSARRDWLTQRRRAKVTKREVSIAFALDGKGNLVASTRETPGKVYAYLPLGETASGLAFSIQADFLVQPGRDAINYEAKWNHWMVDEVQQLCRVAVDEFKRDDRWRTQFLPAFEFTKAVGLESYDRLFGPRLVDRLEEFLKNNECVLTVEGSWAKWDQVVRLAEGKKATEELVTLGVLADVEIASVLGGQEGLRLAAPDASENSTVPIRKVDRQDLLRNADFLKARAANSDAPVWFRSLYAWMSGNPRRIVTQYGSEHRVDEEQFRDRWGGLDGRSYRWEWEHYDRRPFMLTADGALCEGGRTYLPATVPLDAMVEGASDILQKNRPMLHPEVLSGASDDDARERIRKFLTGFAGVQTLTARDVCVEAILPKILVSAGQPAADDLLSCTRYCQQHLGHVDKECHIWVVAEDDSVQRASEEERYLLPSCYRPREDWERHRQHVAGLHFVSPRYLPESTTDAELLEWCSFFLSMSLA